MRSVTAMLLCLAAGCYAPSVSLGLPCSDSGACPIGQECDLLTSVCGLPTEIRVFRDDTAADFETGGPTLTGSFVEPDGFVGPMPYFVGGVRVAGIAAQVIPALTTTWDQVSAAPITGRSLARGLDLDLGNGVPSGLGLAEGDNITVVLEGEIYLDEAGTWGFELEANDIGFFELARPGSDAFVRVAAGDEDTGTYPAATAGWHRFRGAAADAAMRLQYRVRYAPPGGPGGPINFRGIPHDELRAPVGDYAGLMVDGFDDGHLLYHLGSGFAGDALAGVTFGPDPYGMPLGTIGYSIRWAGQILIDVEGEYAFRIDSHQGHRAWIDGVRVANVLDTNARITDTTPIALEPGWHDLVIDVMKVGDNSNGRMSVTVLSGPAWVGENLPLDHLRPAVGRSVRWTSDHTYTSVQIPDNGSPAIRSLSLDLPAGATPLALDTHFRVVHPLLANVGVVLDPLVGANLTLVAPGGLTGAGGAERYNTIPLSRAGAGFTFLVTDNLVDAVTGVVSQVAVTLSYGNAGLAPLDTTSRFTSSPRELGDVVRFGAMRWSIRQPLLPVTVSVRTCDVAAACDAQPWTAVVEGTTPSVEPRRFLQYQIDLESDGDVPTSIDWIELDYITHVES